MDIYSFQLSLVHFCKFRVDFKYMYIYILMLQTVQPPDQGLRCLHRTRVLSIGTLFSMSSILIARVECVKQTYTF